MRFPAAPPFTQLQLAIAAVDANPSQKVADFLEIDGVSRFWISEANLQNLIYGADIGSTDV